MQTKDILPITIFISSLFLFISGSAQDNLSALLPYPNKIITSESVHPFKIPKDAFIEIESDSLKFEAQYLQNILKNRLGITPIICQKSNDQKHVIRLIINPSLKNKEHYILNITENNISISGPTRGAILYGIITLNQILIGDITHTKQSTILPIYIDDQPRIAHRILMLDPARHFLAIEGIKKYIDQMAKYKFNMLQLHLTDDQGWRIEIKKYPKLTLIGAAAKRNTSKREYYSQEQLKNLVKYAADRNVEIVPELDIPGHTAAIIAAYPDLGCIKTQMPPIKVGKTVNLMLCASNYKVYQMYKDIFKEVSAIFPSKWMHLGGDESAIKDNWGKCERCQSLKQKLHYKGGAPLMNYFFDKMLNFIREDGKSPILWCELDNIRMPANKFLFPYPKDATLVSWRNGLTPKCIELSQQSGNQLILAPGEYTYFDYPQYKNDLPEFNNWGMPITTLKKVYAFDPGYGLSKNEQLHIIGICGTLWGEAIQDINRAFYMTYPRAMALSEAGWTQLKFRDWHSFKERMYPNLTDMLKEGVSYRVPFEINQQQQ